MKNDENLKPIFAAYLNMARQNAYVTLLHISKLVGVDTKKSKESKLYNFSVIKELGKRKEDTKSERIQKVIKLLHKHFPFLNAMIDLELRYQNKYIPTELDDSPQLEQQNIQEKLSVVSPMTYYTIFEIVFKLLDSLRNEYTHHSPVCDEEDKSNTQKAIIGYLYNCLDGGRRVVKKRFTTITDRDLIFLTGTPRYDYKKEGNRVISATESSNFYYRLKNKDGMLSHVGTILFTCLFLHKKYVTQFIDQSGLFTKKDCSETEKKIIREIFSVYRIRLPKERLESQRSEYALGMDMLNELQKCPKELFETLPSEKQNIFRVKSDYDEKGNDTNTGEVLLLRNSDRFPYFALRYIDESKAFKNIRFQVALGNYRYSFYGKQCIDSKDKECKEEDRIRSLQKEINGFGRLSEIEQRRKDTWKSNIRTNEKVRKDEAGMPPYLTDHHASYVFNGNRIGLLFNNKDRHDLITKDQESYYLPPLTFKKEEKGKDALCIPPMCWLSIYELPAMIFHHYLCGDNRTEDIIKECVNNYHRLFKDIQEGKLNTSIIFPNWKNKEIYIGTKKNKKLSEEGALQLDTFLYEKYHIQCKDIPDKLIEYLSGMLANNVDAEFTKLAQDKIEKMLCNTRIQQQKFEKERLSLGSKDNKFEKKGYIDIRPGRLALFLAKDILRFQPTNEENNNKVTGLNYQVLQSSLAIYDKSLDELETMFTKANLLNKDATMNHPFLQAVLNHNPENTLDFYQFYLKEKVKYLETLREKNTMSDIPFLYPNRKKWGNHNDVYYKDLAGRYLQETITYTVKHGEEKGKIKECTYYKPIELPRGLFEESIKKLLNEKYGGNIKEIAEATATKPRKRWFNMAFMLPTDDSQERCYNITYLISLYFKHHLKDEAQPFYKTEQGFDYTRTYKIFNLLNDEKEGNKLKQAYYTIEAMKEKLLKDDYTGHSIIDREIQEYLSQFGNSEKETSEKKIAERRFKKYLNEYKDNEKKIRRYKIQDMLTFLMAKELLLGANTKSANTKMSIGNGNRDETLSPEVLQKIEKCKLKNISPEHREQENSLLSISIPFHITLTMEDGTQKTIHQSALKLKNYGDFFQFVYDERIRTLLPQVSKVKIDRKELEKELDNYDLERSQIFALSHSLENAAFQANPSLKSEPFSKEEMPRRNNFRALIATLGNMEEEELNKIVKVRNSFSHNHYTSELNLKESDLPDIAKYICEQFNKLVKKNK